MNAEEITKRLEVLKTLHEYLNSNLSLMNPNKLELLKKVEEKIEKTLKLI